MIQVHCCVGMDISMDLKLQLMHRRSFELGDPRICLETSPGLTCASRYRSGVVSYSVLYLFILLVVFLLLESCIVTNQLENF